MWDLIVSVPDHCLSFYFVQNKRLVFALLFAIHTLYMQITSFA